MSSGQSRGSGGGRRDDRGGGGGGRSNNRSRYMDKKMLQVDIGIMLLISLQYILTRQHNFHDLIIGNFS